MENDVNYMRVVESWAVPTCSQCGEHLVTVYPNAATTQLSGNTGPSVGVSMSWTYCPVCSPVSKTAYEKIMEPWKAPSSLEFTEWKSELPTSTETVLEYGCREVDGVIEIFFNTGYGKGLSLVKLSPKDAKKLARKMKNLARTLEGVE